MTPKRPLRSEVEKEKRLSRPPSGQFNSRPSSVIVQLRGNGSSETSSNRDSVGRLYPLPAALAPLANRTFYILGTTDSAASEEDMVPPPLPVKLRESDYCNLPDGERTSFLYSSRFSFRRPTKPLPPEPAGDNTPPVPPPKPPKHPNHNNNNHDQATD